MSRQLDRETLARILEAEDIEGLSFPELVRLFQGEKGVSNFLPDGVYQIDPRNGDRVLYHSSRARRPHDNQPSHLVAPELEKECVICQGRTTGVIDVADLSQGFTFINKNLFPILYPFDTTRPKRWIGGEDRDFRTSGRTTYGLHFLQWTSSQHDKDWHNMPLSDCVIAMKRLAALEKKLIIASKDIVPVTEQGEHSFVLIIKNYGHLVGGSLAHGHQQIVFSDVWPRHIRDNWLFEREKGEPFSNYLLRENPSELIVKDYGPAILLVPYFMRRPFDMMLLVKEVSKEFLYQLTEDEFKAVSEGWRDAIRVMRSIMPDIGRETAYNVITNNGPGAGLYFEFLPYTQETGGAEHLGLIVCQQSPEMSADRIRELFDKERSCAMIGDKLIIEKHHTDRAAEVCRQIADLAQDKFVMTVAGESGAGKSELASEIVRLLIEQGSKAGILQQDDYFVFPPKTNHEMRRRNLEQVGPYEVKLDFLDSNLRSFKRGESPIYKPLVIFDEDRITTEEMDTSDLKVLIAEGTYTSLLRFIDFRVFIDRDYRQTLEARKHRARDKFEPFILDALEREHHIISRHKALAHVVIPAGFESIQRQD